MHGAVIGGFGCPGVRISGIIDAIVLYRPFFTIRHTPITIHWPLNGLLRESWKSSSPPSPALIKTTFIGRRLGYWQIMVPLHIFVSIPFPVCQVGKSPLLFPVLFPEKVTLWPRPEESHALSRPLLPPLPLIPFNRMNVSWLLHVNSILLFTLFYILLYYVDVCGWRGWWVGHHC